FLGGIAKNKHAGRDDRRLEGDRQAGLPLKPRLSLLRSGALQGRYGVVACVLCKPPLRGHILSPSSQPADPSPPPFGKDPLADSRPWCRITCWRYSRTGELNSCL